MRQDDLAAVEAVSEEALWGPPPPDVLPWWRRRRVEHLLESDPGGCWVAVAPDGTLAGVAIGMRREDVWGLSLLAVSPAHQGRGAGRALLDRALAYGAGATGGIILCTESPAAMRLYARAGFDLRPCVALSGAVRFVPERPGGVRDGDEADLRALDPIARRARGAGYRRDAALLLRFGGRLHVVDGRGWAIGFGSVLMALAADDEEAAAMLLRSFLATAPPGAEVAVHHVPAGHDWAIRVGLEAGLALSATGPLFTRGTLGHMRPYLPNGAFL